MHLLSATFTDFKRFKKLAIAHLPGSARLVLLVGPNGSGKSSVFDGFLQWQRKHTFGIHESVFEYYLRSSRPKEQRSNIIQQQVALTFHEGALSNIDDFKKIFYFRSAYRFEGSFSLGGINPLQPVIDEQRIRTMSDTDVSVSKNYSRLVAQIIDELHRKEGDDTPKGQWRDQKYKPLQDAINRLFPHLFLEGPGKPLEEGTFYFTKGEVSNFKYGNLSSGEKAALDLLLDLYMRGIVYKDGIFCIDEPEAHMNTNLHGELLEELYRFVPESGQLWIATHSVGMIRKSIELSQNNPGAVVFLDFHEHDFDQEITLTPAVVNASFWSRNLRTTLADLSELVAPSRVVLCEGARVATGARNAEFDAQCYQRIFEQEFADTIFISVGSSNDIITGGAALRAIVKRIAQGIDVVQLIDRDERTTEEVEEAEKAGQRVLPKRQIECYLLADEILEKLCRDAGKPEALPDIMAAKANAINNLPTRGYPPNDIKRAKGDIYNAVKRVLFGTRLKFGSNADAFCRDVMAPLITPDTATYQELKGAIFGR